MTLRAPWSLHSSQNMEILSHTTGQCAVDLLVLVCPRTEEDWDGRCCEDIAAVNILLFNSRWRRYGLGNVMLGFSSGYFVVVSTHMNKIGQELFQTKNHTTRLNDIACSMTLGKAASCGDNW